MSGRACENKQRTPSLQSASAVLNSAQKSSTTTKMAHPRPPESERCFQFYEPFVDVYEDGAPLASRVRALCSIQRRSRRLQRRWRTQCLQSATAVRHSTQKSSTSTKMSHPRPTECERCVQLCLFLLGGGSKGTEGDSIVRSEKAFAGGAPI